LLSKGDWYDGKKDGSHVKYWGNGQLWIKGNSKNGNRDGYWVWYNRDGTVWTENTGTYKDGKKISD